MFKLMVSAELDENGLCRPSGQFDHVDFFPVDGSGVARAKAICNGDSHTHGVCPVRDECLEYALVNRIDHGVWGGQSERARRITIKSRKSSRKITERPTSLLSSASDAMAELERTEAEQAEQWAIEDELHQAALEDTVQLRQELAG